MESTGVYWKPIYNLLEGRFTVLLVNAKHFMNVFRLLVKLTTAPHSGPEIKKPPDADQVWRPGWCMQTPWG
jgi:hypothetical protein